RIVLLAEVEEVAAGRAVEPALRLLHQPRDPRVRERLLLARLIRLRAQLLAAALALFGQLEELLRFLAEPPRARLLLGHEQADLRGTPPDALHLFPQPLLARFLPRVLVRGLPHRALRRGHRFLALARRRGLLRLALLVQGLLGRAQ